jgi:hypothetical protein
MLIEALKNSFDMSIEDASELSQIVQKPFNGNNEIEDRVLDKDTRSLFYDLYQNNLLSIRREEVTEGDSLKRTYYWSFNVETIKTEASRKSLQESPYSIYKKLPDEFWYRRTL